MATEKTETLRDWVRRTHPNHLIVGSVNRIVDYDDHDLPERHPCYRCVAYKNRNPKDCDPCDVNPDRARLKKAGLL